MPVTDIRVSVGFFDHPKTQRLRHELGADAVVALQRIWVFAAQYRPKGILSGLTTADIRAIANWSDDSDLVGALIRIGFIDQGRDALKLHDWSDHNRFAFFGPERVVQSRKAAKTRWYAKRGNPRRRKAPKADADRNAERNADSNTDRNAERNAPIPIPTPPPTPVGGGDREALPSASADAGVGAPPHEQKAPGIPPEVRPKWDQLRRDLAASQAAREAQQRAEREALERTSLPTLVKGITGG